MTTPPPEDSPRITATRRLFLRLTGHPIEEEAGEGISLIALCVVVLMALLIFVPVGFSIRQSYLSLDESKQLTQSLEHVERLGVDQCTIQWISALAFERANNRPSEMAPFDRAAWNLSQFHAAKLLREQPHLSEEQMVAEVTNVIRDVYKNPSITHCGPP